MMHPLRKTLSKFLCLVLFVWYLIDLFRDIQLNRWPWPVFDVIFFLVFAKNFNEYPWKNACIRTWFNDQMYERRFFTQRAAAKEFDRQQSEIMQLFAEGRQSELIQILENEDKGHVITPHD